MKFFLRWLDSWNQKADSLEATGIGAFLVGIFIGAILTSAATSHSTAALLELCLKQGHP